MGCANTKNVKTAEKDSTEPKQDDTVKPVTPTEEGANENGEPQKETGKKFRNKMNRRLRPLRQNLSLLETVEQTPSDRIPYIDSLHHIVQKFIYLYFHIKQ
uniref:uncharacterized protein LOC120332452 n=1 Tax=Styela clava TaxID=7725 RepID=UPI001939B187|nr:uncharacterized protein LOC120332452 [Styela clava]